MPPLMPSGGGGGGGGDGDTGAPSPDIAGDVPEYDVDGVQLPGAGQQQRTLLGLIMASMMWVVSFGTDGGDGDGDDDTDADAAGEVVEEEDDAAAK
jgi:hypothetical protein